MLRLSRRYAVWYNRVHSHTGPVWQGRFHSSVLEPASLQKLTLYMEGLPVREGFVKRPEQYVWSSYAHHAGFRTDPFLTEPDAGDESRALRDAACTLTGNSLIWSLFSRSARKRSGRQDAGGRSDRRRLLTRFR